jgi:hypothetical protein
LRAAATPTLRAYQSALRAAGISCNFASGCLIASFIGNNRHPSRRRMRPLSQEITSRRKQICTNTREVACWSSRSGKRHQAKPAL